MAQARRQSAKRNRLLTAAASVAGHLVILLVLVRAQPDSPVAEPPPMIVQLIQLQPEPPAPPVPKPAPEPPAPTPPKPRAAPVEKPSPPRKAIARPAPAPPEVAVLVAETGQQTNPDAEVSDAELASAATADSGGGGGRSCNMLSWLQGKLRKDRRVQAAMADAHRGRAIRVWNGDWVRHPGQDGNGLAAVREAIMWEVAFAPEACRAERVRGLVSLSLNDGPGSARVVMGSGDWRWTDVVSRSRR
ncbi:MAG: hypothetical protein EPO51_01475 [Phenylobacterium sp.]|uniref:hypothetical protein n=1 Tax=Phenylobacterium sp. TaxID=1871053 RepID=UPI0011FB656E|nr:hypothetical protein [Phenylobacterium sp.]TAJ74756.1 MAG: hypothetical protein EPO51_01475 [Phenylobacterium sp.]